MVGIASDGSLNDYGSEVGLIKYKGIYIPPRHYSACEPLPDEWLENIPNVVRYNREMDLLISNRFFEQSEEKQKLSLKLFARQM